MKNQFSDKTVIIIIISTILIIFFIIFTFNSTLPTQDELLQWKESSINNSLYSDTIQTI